MAAQPVLEGGKFQKEDQPREKIELLIDRCWDLVSNAMVEYESNDRRIRAWNEMLTVYGNIYNRTNKLFEESMDRFRYKHEMKDKELIAMICLYLGMLQEKGLNKVGFEELVFNA